MARAAVTLLCVTLSSRQAVVLYASHPEFEQTNVIEGQIDEAPAV